MAKSFFNLVLESRYDKKQASSCHYSGKLALLRNCLIKEELKTKDMI